MTQRLTLLVFAACLLTAGAQAEQALVRNYQNSSLEVGQGYLTHYDGVCYLLLPIHVAEEAGSTAALLGEGVEPLLGETAALADLGDDVGLAVVRGGITGSCGYGALSISRAVERTIRDNGIATIRSVNGDGSIAQVSVSLFDDDGERFLRVQPTRSDNQLRKGQSGSLLVVGDKPIGMLLSVDARFGVGKVIRLDTMLAKFDDHVRGQARSATGQAQAAAVAPPAGSPMPGAVPVQSPQTVAGQPLELLSWNALAATEMERPINLLALDDSPPWRANVSEWPVVLEFSLGESRKAIRGVRLEASPADPELWPASVEIFVSATEGRDRWRSLFGGAPAYSDGVAEISSAPMWARKIRLVIGASAGQQGQVSLNRLRVLPAD